MYKALLTINYANIGTIGVFNSDADFRTGGAPIRTYDITVTALPKRQMHKPHITYVNLFTL